jgi:hypothetical protein
MADQLLDTAHGLFTGRHDLLVLTIDEARLRSPVVWEDLYEAGREFPHIYGPVELDAVVAVHPLPHDDEGRFDWWRPDDAPVARRAGAQSPAVQALLQHFADAEFEGAPRPLGIARGLELVSHLPGTAITTPYPAWLDEAAMSSLGALIRAAHDASESFSTQEPWIAGDVPKEPGQVILHRDIGPGNVLWIDGRATGLIDWELAEPGDRLFDVGVAAVTFAGYAPPERARDAGVDPLSVDDRLRALAVGYRDVSPTQVKHAAKAALEAKLFRIRKWGGQGLPPWEGFLVQGIDERIEEILEWLDRR